MFPYGQMHQRTQVLCMINDTQLENKYSCEMLSSDKLGFYYKRLISTFYQNLCIIQSQLSTYEIIGVIIGYIFIVVLITP